MREPLSADEVAEFHEKLRAKIWAIYLRSVAAGSEVGIEGPAWRRAKWERCCRGDGF
jgi:hypothetical protein